MPLPEMLDRAAAGPVGRMDVEDLWRRGRRRRARVAGTAGVAVVAVAAAALLALPELTDAGRDRSGLAVAPPPATDPAATTAETATAASPSPAQPSPAQPVERPWGELTLAEAIDRLIAVNRSAPAQPEFTPGTERVTRTVRAYALRGDSGVAIEVYLYEVRRAFDGSWTEGYAMIEKDLDTGTDADRLREIVAGTDLGALVLSSTSHPAEESNPGPDRYLAEAEVLATSRPTPQPGETERPPQSRAFRAVTDGLTMGELSSPQARLRALEVLASLDPGVVEFRGLVRDLLGREGVGIAHRDPQDQILHTLIFSPDTGEILGEERTWVNPANGRPEQLGLSAVLEARVVDADER